MKKNQIMLIVLMILASVVGTVLCDWKVGLDKLDRCQIGGTFNDSAIDNYCHQNPTAEECQILGNAIESANQHFKQQKKIDELRDSIKKSEYPEVKAIFQKKMKIEKEKFPNYDKTYLETLTPEELKKLNEAKENLLLSIKHKYIDSDYQKIAKLLGPVRSDKIDMNNSSLGKDKKK